MCGRESERRKRQGVRENGSEIERKADHKEKKGSDRERKR